jgi:hypothetical protein
VLRRAGVAIRASVASSAEAERGDLCIYSELCKSISQKKPFPVTKFELAQIVPNGNFCHKVLAII